MSMAVEGDIAALMGFWAGYVDTFGLLRSRRSNVERTPKAVACCRSIDCNVMKGMLALMFSRRPSGYGVSEIRR